MKVINIYKYNISDYLARKQQGLVTENMFVPKKHSSRNFRIRTLLSHRQIRQLRNQLLMFFANWHLALG